MARRLKLGNRRFPCGTQLHCRTEETIRKCSENLLSKLQLGFLSQEPYSNMALMHWECAKLSNSAILSSLYVEKLIIPAIPDLLETWISSFSFKPLEFYDKNEIRNLNVMLFAETTLLQKPICNSETEVDRDKSLVNILPWRSPEYSRHSYVATLGTCEEIKGPSCASDTSLSLDSRYLNGSMPEILPVQSASIQNLSTDPWNLTSPVNMGVTDSSVGSKIASTPNRYVRWWM